MTQLRFSLLSPHFHHSLSQQNNNNNNNNTLSLPFPSSSSSSQRFFHLHNNKNNNPSSLSSQNFKLHSSSADGGNNGGGTSGGNNNGGNDGDHNNDENSNDPSSKFPSFGLLGLFLEGWRSRVEADPQFPFKLLMEELVGVPASILGDMASRPNFGLNELDLVFSTLVVGSIISFTVMYLLAPTASISSTTTLPSIFSTCPKSHMFEPGLFSVMDRFGTLVYKGSILAVAGLAAGLVGTLVSNGLMKMRTKMENSEDDFEKVGPTKKSPHIVLNALTWAAHMGISSNLRYQSLNGIEFVLERGLSPSVFKSSVLVLRILNNVVGGISFVVLARLTGAQSVGEQDKKVVEIDGAEEKDKFLVDGQREKDF